MKKVLVVVLSLMMVFMFAACGANDDPDNVDPSCFKIGVMQFGEFTALQNAFDGFVLGLEDAGWVEGTDFVINYLSAAADTANCPTIADTLINDKSDLIFAIATPSIKCLQEKTSDIPVLFTAVTDPVASDVVKDAKLPGGNISGTSDMNPVKEQIEFLKKVMPNAQTVAVMYCSSESNSAVQFDMAKAQLEAMGMTCVQKTVSAIDEVKSSIESLKGQVDAIYVPTDNTLSDGMSLVSSTADECGIPVFGGEPGMVENGCTASYGIDYVELGRMTGKMAVEALTSQDPLGAVANMPIGYQTSGCMTAFNQASLDAVGLEVPADVLTGATIF